MNKKEAAAKFPLRAKDNTKERPRCMECRKLARWVRVTQFSGNHHFCDEHAKKEANFGKEDPSYFFWRKL
jgi:hypothetical protein